MTAKQPLLTLAIPTFNRLACLRLLLDAIASDCTLPPDPALLEVLVLNNASTDGSTEYLQELAAMGHIRLVQQPQNIGADANVIQCMRQARGVHLWICGDDDLPLPGVVPLLLAFLAEHQPSLLYLPAVWHDRDLSGVRREAPSQVQPRAVSAEMLAAHAGTYITFLSSWVVRREAYMASPEADPGRYAGSSLPQLAWHLRMLCDAPDLYLAPEPWLLARGGNSGGYGVFETFVTGYERILREELSERPALMRVLEQQLLRGYLPGLVWALRIGALGRFAPMDCDKIVTMLAAVWPAQKRERAWLRRIAEWPLPIAKMAMARCWLDARFRLSRGLRAGSGGQS